MATTTTTTYHLRHHQASPPPSLPSTAFTTNPTHHRRKSPTIPHTSAHFYRYKMLRGKWAEVRGIVGDLRRWWVGLVVEEVLGSDGGGEASGLMIRTLSERDGTLNAAPPTVDLLIHVLFVLTKQVKIAVCGLLYIVVAIMGPQRSVLELGREDLCTLIFTLSAMPLDRMSTSVKCFSVLKPGGLLFFTDYGNA
ncbi:hypothetical protein Tco_1080951 [Tanacetum coccineum]|uniref:Uncharacterized protein n=1 Tax=Tanacetum coccineum TaxID=301880 RepID=A0ABQ5HW75_9ASTR